MSEYYDYGGRDARRERAEGTAISAVEARTRVEMWAVRRNDDLAAYWSGYAAEAESENAASAARAKGYTLGRRHALEWVWGVVEAIGSDEARNLIRNALGDDEL